MADPRPPLIVEVTRGTLVESRHRCTAAVTDADGDVVGHWGDIERPIYGRSAIKPLLALGLVETGAADAFGLGNAEIALACASHDGEPRHIATLLAWLGRARLTVGDLECGPHLPYHEPSAKALIRAGTEPDSRYNNCSGKHAGFLTTAVHMGEPTKGYIRFEHPVQQRLLGILEQMTGRDLGEAPRGIDGCGIPTIAAPLGNTAMAMARLADPAGLPPARAAAAKRVITAMTAEPMMVGGSRQFVSALMQATGGRIAAKTGAEGVLTAAIPGRGLGICVKAEDGGARAAEVAMGRILADLGLIEEEERQALAKRLTPPILNRAGLEVGEIRIAADAAF
jgi:L-asparaginase II